MTIKFNETERELPYELDLTNITNFYSHCGSFWEIQHCDSEHNDRCPDCNKEIEPYKSKHLY